MKLYKLSTIVSCAKILVFTASLFIASFDFIPPEIETPFPFSVNDKHVSDLLTCFNSGWRLRSPWHCKPSELHPTYRTMLDCWNLEPSERPDFSTLAKTFAEQSPDKKNFEARNTDLKVAYSTIVRPTKGAEAGNDQQGEGEKEYLEVIPSPEKEEILRENAPVDFVSDVLF